jgi:hypothetical protein
MSIVPSILPFGAVTPLTSTPATPLMMMMMMMTVIIKYFYSRAGVIQFLTPSQCPNSDPSLVTFVLPSAQIPGC